MTKPAAAVTWYYLPAAVNDWLRPGELHAVWLPRDGDLSNADMLSAHDTLNAWDQLVGRMLRAVLFDEFEDPRRLRKQAEAVAAVAEALAVRLGELR